MTSSFSTSDDALYDLLGISSSYTSGPSPEIQSTGLTRSAFEATKPSLTADIPVDTVPPALEAKRKHKRGITSRVRRSAERQSLRIPLEEDSDEPVKETVNTAPRLRADPSPTPKLEPEDQPLRSNPYWMYGQGLSIPPYNASGGKGDAQVKKDDVKVLETVKERDFADIHPDIAVKQEESGDLEVPVKVEKADQVTPHKQYNATNLLEQLMESIESSQPVQTTSMVNLGKVGPHG
jgi:hypothetical protein